MKKGMRILALSMTLAFVGTSVPVSAAPVSKPVVETVVGAFSLSSWWNNLWSSIIEESNKNKNGKDTAQDSGTSSETGSNKGNSTEEKNTPENTDSVLDLVEDESTVEEGTELRASTYALSNKASTQADSDTTIKYFPITMYNYEAATINDATHQVEVDNGPKEKWEGIYFNDGKPSAESYTYTLGEASYTETTVKYNDNNDYSKYENNGYYVNVDGTKYLVTDLTCMRSIYWVSYTYSWTITYAGGTATSSDRTITLYKANNTTTTDSLNYAAWNWWNKNKGNNDYGQYTYSGLVNRTLTANKDITFIKPDGGIFNSDATVKSIYTNVEMPFVYDNGTYTFDASQNGAYFYNDRTQKSTTAQSNGRLYFDKGNPQSNGGNYGDGSTTVWMPFNSTRSIDGESNCDYHFGMRTTIPFTMTANGKMNPNDNESKDITFSFSGDDDVWVFIDGQLVIDLGGIHNRLDATINFAQNTWEISESNTSNVPVADTNGEAISGTIFNAEDTNGTLNQTRETFAASDSHELTIFYLERGAGSSNCKIQFNLPMKDTVTVTKHATQSISSDETITPLTAKEQETVNNIDFGFTLTKDGAPVANTNYNLLNENGQVISTPSTDGNGHFTLRNGQTAKFIGEIAADGANYQVEEDAVENIGFKLPTYSYGGTAARGFTVSDTSYSDGSAIPATQKNLTSAAVTAKGSTEAEDSLQFICENYFDANLPNPTSKPVDDQIVIDYGLPVVIDVLANDVYRGDQIEITKVEGAKYGEAEIENGKKIKYQLTEQLTGVEVLTYTAKVTNSDEKTDEKEAKVYIIPATRMYYEENFSNLVTFSDGWNDEGNSQTDPQEPGVVGTVGDSPYGSDVAYLNDNGDSNGLSKHVSTVNAAASFSYTFTGTGTSFFARTTNNTAYIRVQVKQGDAVIYTGYRDTSYKTTENNTTLYNIPVFTYDAEQYGTYEVVVSIGKSNATLKYGSDFWLDGISVVSPLDSRDANVSVANAAYATDGEANMTVVTLRQKLLHDSTKETESGLEWNDGENFVIFTDSNGEIQSAEEYESNGPKEEVYLNVNQSVTFSLKNWDANSNKIYLGIKAPMGSGSVAVNGNSLAIHNATDCYYDISNFAKITTDEEGTTVATFEVKATEGLISVTNIKVTGNVEFTIIQGENVNEDAEGDEEEPAVQSELSDDAEPYDLSVKEQSEEGEAAPNEAVNPAGESELSDDAGVEDSSGNESSAEEKNAEENDGATDGESQAEQSQENTVTENTMGEEN